MPFAPPSPTSRRSASFLCRGHVHVTGQHGKSLELTRDREITGRATCIVGVSSEHDDRELLALRGDVDIRLECGSAHDELRATISPFFLGDDSLVVRPTAGLRGRTFAFGATKTAADLDRDLVAALEAPEAELHVTITERGGPPGPGALFVVSLPIGNDGDLSPRAARVLERVDVVMAEDTRRLGTLAERTAIHPAPAISYHDHNEARRAPEVIEWLSAGARVALVSDAGTPLSSDPGYVLVRRAVEAGIAVSPVPGPSAPLAVLVASGLPVDRYLFAGFLPRRSSARQQLLRKLVAGGTPVVCHEAPHRLVAFLRDVDEVCGDWQVCVGHEVTKVFESFHRGHAAELVAAFEADPPRGEYTVVLAPPVVADDEAAPVEPLTALADDLVAALLDEGIPASTVARALRAATGAPKREAYDRVLSVRRDAASKVRAGDDQVLVDGAEAPDGAAGTD